MVEKQGAAQTAARGANSVGPRARVWLAVAALLLFTFLALDSLVGDSPTMDEQNHIARGLAFLRTGDPRLSLEHPPLVNALSALPLLTMPELRLPTDHPSWERREGWYEFADLFLWQYNHDVDRIVYLSRLPIVALHIALALTGYRFARRLWGGAAGVVALWLHLFEPNLLAHGRYATTDMGGTLFTFLATFLLWRLWAAPTRQTWRRWAPATLAVGLAFGSKMSALGFAPVWIVLAVLPLYPDGGRGQARAAARRLGQLAAAGLVALLVVWAIYGFQWGNFQFISPDLAALNGRAGPMPTFWAGVEPVSYTHLVSKLESAIVMRALKPFASRLLQGPSEVLEAISNLDAATADLRATLSDPSVSSYRVVLQPEKMVMREAERAISCLLYTSRPSARWPRSMVSTPTSSPRSSNCLLYTSPSPRDS